MRNNSLVTCDIARQLTKIFSGNCFEIGYRRNKKFRRQHPIGIYTADFYCAEARDRFMLSQGIRVLRFTGKQVEFETESVLAQA